MAFTRRRAEISHVFLTMKIFASNVIPEIDNATCEAQNIDSVELMERAAGAVSCEIISRFLPSQRIVVVAAPAITGATLLLYSYAI